MLAPAVGQEDEGDRVSLQELQCAGCVRNGVGAPDKNAVYTASLLD